MLAHCLTQLICSFIFLPPGHQTKVAASYEIYYVVKRLGSCLLFSWFAWSSSGPEESTFVRATSMLGREAMTRVALRSGDDGSPSMAMGNAMGLWQWRWQFWPFLQPLLTQRRHPREAQFSFW